MVAAYFLTLVALAAAALFREGRFFGLREFRHAPPAAIVVAAIVAVAVPFFLRRKEAKQSAPQRSDSYFLFLAVVAALAFGFVLRARGFYLGDGWQSLALLGGPRPFVKEDAAATGVVLRMLARAFSGGPSGALAAYETVSLVAGALFLFAVSSFGFALAPTARDRRLLLLFLAAGGWSLLFFGYVENYPLFVAATGAYALAGARAARDGQGLWEAVVFAMVATSLHIAGLLLLPSLVVLLLGRSPIARAVLRIPRAWLAGGAVALVAGAAFAVERLLAGNLTRDLLFVPLPSSPFVADGYTLFSGSHLADLANLSLLLVPGIAVLAVALARAPLRVALQDPAVRFALFLAVTLTAAVFVLDPKLGMPRDWDSFAFTGIPWALVVFLLLTAPGARAAESRYALELATVLGFLVLLARASTNANEGRAYAEFRDDLLLDPARGRPARIHAVNHWRRLGRDDLAEQEAEAWDRDYPERVLVQEATDARSHGDADEAKRLNRAAIARAPTYSDPWNNLGSIDLSLGHVSDAESEFTIAHALSPSEPAIWMNLGSARFAAGDLDGASKWWLRVWERAPDGALVNKALARLAQHRGDTATYEHYLARAAAAPEAPGGLLAEWADRLAARGRTAEALATYREALARGLDDNTRTAVLTAHPELAGPVPALARGDLVPPAGRH